MSDTLAPDTANSTARARIARHRPVRPARRNSVSILRPRRESFKRCAHGDLVFMARRVSHGRVTLGSNFRDTVLVNLGESVHLSDEGSPFEARAELWVVKA